MKNLQFSLITEYEEAITIGLVRLAKSIPDYEFFYKVNVLNRFQFKKIADLQITKEHYDYWHTRFEAYDEETETEFQFIQNKSTKSILKKEATELFIDEESINFLDAQQHDADYLLKTSDSFADFSLILLPENETFPVQSLSLNPESELYQIIQYYE